jgi:hypothetical protein
MKSGDARQVRMQRILNIVIDEAMEELATVPGDSLTIWMSNMARVTQWVATGDMRVLPEELIPFACKVEGIDYTAYIAARNAPAADDDIADAEIVEEPIPIEAG